jgi:GNAT superfamily N-acetyltransferase
VSKNNDIPLTIENYQPGQEVAISDFIRRVYDEFVAGDYSEEGNRVFYDWIEPSKMADRQRRQNTLLVAMVDSEIVGMVEMRDRNIISLLFVDKRCQGRGIARRLIERSLHNCLGADPRVDRLCVHASPFSIPIYRKLGFVETDVMQEQFGIKYLPMEMMIAK